jgi:hypothetical protein
MTENKYVYRANGLLVTLDHLHLEPTDKKNGRRRVYRLLSDYCLLVSFKGGQEEMTVPAGFETDLATLPVFTQVLLGNRDDYAEPAVFHDWITSDEVHLPQFIANAKMRSIMQALGYPTWKQLLVFYGLMVFGYGSVLSRCWRWLIGRIKCGF